jgi:hypothetical protein
MPSPRPFAIAVAVASIVLALPAFAEAPDLDRVMSIVIEGTNRFRQEHRLATLENDSKLAATARDFAEFMARTDKYGHAADDLGLVERIRRHGYAYCLLSENIGYRFRSDGFKTAAELADGFVEGWKRSPGHRKNMMERDATEIGVAGDAQPEDRPILRRAGFRAPRLQHDRVRGGERIGAAGGVSNRLRGALAAEAHGADPSGVRARTGRLSGPGP